MTLYEVDVTLVGDRQTVITRLFDAPRELVWRCHTEPPLVRRWLGALPGWTFPVCDIDLRVGGRYRYVWKSPEGHEMGMGGVFTEVEPPARLGSTEIFDEDWTGGETQGLIVLEEKGPSRTLLVQTVTYASKDAREGALSTGMTDGMQVGYRRLDELLAEELDA
jgi:uncharacterized protein YndB with AHSA1/START domain